MSATFWNMRRKAAAQRAKENAKPEPVKVNPAPVVNDPDNDAEKPKRGRKKVGESDAVGKS